MRSTSKILLPTILASSALFALSASSAWAIDKEASRERATILRIDGRNHEHGENGSPRNPEKAFEMYCEAARLGDVEAQYNLGWMLANGRGIPRDDATASYFFALAAKQGDSHAARMLARLGDPVAKPPSCMSSPVDEDDLALQIPPDQQKIFDLVSKLARKYVTVALTGDGGDEILGGYQRHTHVPALWNKISWMPSAVRRTVGNLALRVPQETYDSIRPSYPQFGRRVHRMAQVVAQGDTHSLYTSLLQVWPEKEQVVPGATMPLIPLDDPNQWPSDLTLAEKMIYGDTLSYRPNDLMVKADRASMAVALEARAPLMDYELCEYSWRLPHDMKIRGLEGKWLLRKLLEQHVPREMFDRPKAGFNVPLHQWLKGPLKSWGDALLDRDRLKNQNLLNADLAPMRPEAIVADLQRRTPEAVLIGHSGSTSAHPTVLHLAALIRAALPDARIVYGGAYPS